MIKVCIDPGHGGKSRYNRGPSGYIEADGVLKISKYLKSELEATGKFSVILTRDKDMTLGLTERAMIAVRNKVDLFISEHTDAGPVTAGGTTVFYSVDIPGDKVLAEKIASAVSSALGIRNRGAKTRASTSNPGEDYYTVIDVAQDGGVPHVILVESAFHSNPNEEKLLLQDEMLKKIAKAQAQAIMDFFGVGGSKPDNQQPKPNNPSTPSVRVLKYTVPVMTGGDVKEVQQRLKKYGVDPGPIDGKFGPKTQEGVKDFQKLWGLEVDGIVGPKTREKLFGNGIPPLKRNLKYTRPTMRGDDVKIVQRKLLDAGFNPKGIDGRFGPNTKRAVEGFQKKKKITVDGIVGPITWKTLFS